MYLHTKASFHQPVPKLLRLITFTRGASNRRQLRYTYYREYKEAEAKVEKETTGNGAPQFSVITYALRICDKLQDNATIASIHASLHQITELLSETARMEEIVDMWNHVCYRLDIFALIITQSINVIIFAWWMSLS